MVGTLYTKSTYSILSSTLSLETIFKFAKNNGHDFVAIADTDNLHGLYKTLVLSKKYKIPAIIGYSHSFDVLDKKVDLLVFAKDDKALKNLIKLVSQTSVDPQLTFESMLSLLNQLVVILPSSQTLFDLDEVESDLVVQYLNQKLNHFYLGISNANDSELIKTNIIQNYASKYRIKMLPTYMQSYLKAEDLKTYKIVNTIRDQSFEFDQLSRHALSKNELIKQYQQVQSIFKNVSDLFIHTHYSYLDNTQSLPVFPTKDGVKSHVYLYALAHKGLEKRLERESGVDQLLYKNRLDHELSVINKMGYDDYFLIVYDFVRFAKTNDILVGPGRGSAAGSLVAYCLGITEVDPIKYDLLFERFLNIDRKSMPDIDLDFPDNKRDLVIDYVKEKYGAYHVVTMSTFTNLTSKTSMRDIARQMQMSNERINAIIASHAKGILDETDYEAQALIEVASLIEGIPRQTGTHPAGIILSKQDLSTLVPLTNGPKNTFQSQLEASDLEALGFLKIDFLGLKNLSMIETVLSLNHHKIKLSEIPLNDYKTFELLENADVEGIFQLESQGMRSVLRKLKPENFEDIVAILALFRPGPMQFIDEYIKRRHGQAYEALDPSIDDILKPTYGIIVYQEQIMKILQVYAGYALSEADTIRRAIAKKDHTILKQEETKFIERAVKLGKDRTRAETIYNYIERFADYGFNRSHSVAYALIAYHMAYLKTHDYKAFMAALLSQNTSNTQFVKTLVSDVLGKGLTVLPPDIEKSTTEFIPTNSGLLSPLTLIKGLGINLTQKLIQLRPFNDFNTFKQKVKGVLNEKQIESLIHANALDSFGLNHQTLLDNNHLDQSGFEAFLDDYQGIKRTELPFDALQSYENEVLGFNIKYTKDDTLIKLIKDNQLKSFTLKDTLIQTIGQIESKRVIQTKHGDDMAFINFKGEHTLDLTLFPEVYKKYYNLLEDTYIYIEATKDLKDHKQNKYIVKKIKKVRV